MNIKHNLERARGIMKKAGIDCLILAPSTDLVYMTGFTGISLERPIFLMLLKEQAYFVAPEFELSDLSEDIRRDTACIGWREDEDPYEKIKSEITEERLCAAAGNRMTAEMFYHFQETFSGWRWCLGDEVMRELRMKKTEEECENLKMAQVMAGNAFEKLLAGGLEGQTEREVAERLNQCMEAEGLFCSGYPLVAAGKNSAVVHHAAGETVIRAGDVVVIDFGGIYNGYYSDITRTVVVKEEPEGFSDIYAVVRRANETAFEAARAGITGEKLDQAARDVIEHAGYGEYFTHRLGHGIGRDIHEPPYIVKGNKEVLEVGNAFSNEPGIYIPGQFGIRLEDVLVVEEDGARCLTELPHDYMVVD